MSTKNQLLYVAAVLCCLTLFAVVQPAGAVVTINTVAEDGTISAWYKSGALWTSTSIELGLTARRVVLADPLGTGGNDMYVATSDGIRRVYATGGGTSLAAQEIGAAGDRLSSYSIAAGDADNDGTLDLVVGTFATIDKFAWNGSTWGFNRIKDSTGANVMGVAIADTDNDGINEVAAGWYNGISILAGYEHQGGGVYQEMALVPVPGTGTIRQLQGGDVDINGDGVKDFILAGDGVIQKVDFVGDTANATPIWNSGGLNMASDTGNVDGDAYVDIVWGLQGNIQRNFYTDPVTQTAELVGQAWQQGTVTGIQLYDIDGDGLDEVIAVSWDLGQIRLYDYDAVSGLWSTEILALGTGENFMDLQIGDIGVVPEPATIVLLGAGLAGLVARRKRK